ncbi:MAG TPA: NADH-quinone oxidoreductase subunit NuoE [Bacteroidales bacterium]|nr:NADH-quinone oxidoreductase subunit NuoE [Bacteroidales bacterium]
MSNIEDILRRYRSGSHDNLIPILQEVQGEEGFIPEEAIIKIGSFLGMSTSKIYGLATFYDQFRFVPYGKVHLRICNGTTCFINGSTPVINAVKETFGTDPGQTTRDGRFSFELTACMGGCNEGPVIKVGDDYYSHLRTEDIPEMVRKLKNLADLQ